MLKQHNQLMLSLLIVADAIAVALAWLIAFWLRFKLFPVDPSKGMPTLADKYLPMLPLVVITHVVIFYRVRLYKPRRERSLFTETRDIVKAFVVAAVAVVLIDYAMPATNKISRQFIATYAVVGCVCFALFRGVARAVLQAMRRRGMNRRTAAIIGTGRSAQRLLHALRRNAWTGLDVLYFIDDPQPNRRAWLRQLPVREPLDDLRGILEGEPVDAVFVALSSHQSHLTDPALAQLETCTSDVRLIPDITPAYTMNPNVSQLDGVPILALRQTPLYGWNAVVKRVFDVLLAALMVVVAAVPMAIIAAVVKLSSRGPVFYKQRRMGMDGREFDMIKFRSMRTDAEAATGAVWAAANDTRRTPVGRFLRRTSLDELPQLFNVLAGNMSLVGPRPERPELIEQFKDEIPRYMLRHKMKAGMTGYAQIHGLRGNTPLKKRIQYDLHYIRNWSLGLDVRILAMTLAGAWFSEQET